MLSVPPMESREAALLTATARAQSQFAIGAGVGTLAVGAAVDIIASVDRASLAQQTVVLAIVLIVLLALMRRNGVFAVSSALTLSILGAAVVAAQSGAGIHSLTFGVCGVAVFAACVVCGLRVGAGLAALSVLLLCAMFSAQVSGLVSGATIEDRRSVAGALGMHVLFVGLSLLLGWLASRVVRASISEARYEQRRARRLLSLTADWTWEQDEELRFSFIDGALEGQTALRAADMIGKRRWEIHGSSLSDAQWTAHRTDLEARRPFRDLLVERLAASGERVSISVSGEPIFDENGAFRGYWGVARDVTTEHKAQRALAMSEQRYRDLFEHLPTALVLHRQCRILKANAAAAELFRFRDAAAMVGTAMLDLYAANDQARIARRITQLEESRPGDPLPSTEVHLVAKDGGEVFALGTGMRTDTNDGAATLSVYFDVTERRQARELLRRSEQMLSRLFDASPDPIIVSEVGSSRLVMVNERFSSLFGYAREEAIGRTSLELGLWPRPEERARLVAALARDGVVHDMPVTRRTRNGRTLSMMYSAARMSVDGRDYLLGTIRDVTEQDRLRREYEAILQNASVGIAFTRDRTFRLVNPRFEQMLGWEPGSLVDQPGSVVWPSAKDYVTVGGLIGPKLEYGETVDFEWTLRKRDGAQMLAHIRARALDRDHPAAGGTIWIVEDITERRAFELTLADARDAAEAANRAKSAFLANMSHELRTPLNGVIGLARLALDPKLPADKRTKYLHGVIDSAQTLTRIVSDVLDLSKIEAGKLSIENDDFDLHGLLDTIEVSYGQLAAEKGLEFSLRRGPGVPRFVRGDALRVRQILGNFLSNALKFTARGRIDLSVERAERGLKMAVRDTGIGIDRRSLDRLFARFTQADASTTRRFGGTGLGLSICRQLAYLMKGEVGVDSEPGSGSTFWAILPLPAAAAPPQGDVRIDGEGLAGLRVLLAEDNEVNLLIAEAMLQSWGVVVAQATDGRAAIEAVERAFEQGTPFDAVLMDMQMPVMSGYEATATLRQRYDKRQLPIIALTAAVLATEQENSSKLGMNDFVGKPIDEAQLHEALARVRSSVLQ